MTWCLCLLPSSTLWSSAACDFNLNPFQSQRGSERHTKNVDAKLECGIIFFVKRHQVFSLNQPEEDIQSTEVLSQLWCSSKMLLVILSAASLIQTLPDCVSWRWNKWEKWHLRVARVMFLVIVSAVALMRHIFLKQLLFISLWKCGLSEDKS